MGWRSNLFVAAVLVLAGLGASACGGSDGPTGDVQLSDEATITYRFGDASLPPEYHRSYTLTITRNRVHLAVDSYGIPITQAFFEMDNTTWQRLATAPRTLVDVVPETAQDCDGGTTRALTIVDGDSSVMDLFTEVCGGRGTKAAATIDAYVAPALAIFGDLDDYLEMGREP